MSTKYLILVLNGLTQGALFFILGSGLTLTFGLMNVVNMSHGAFYLLGGYISYSVLRITGNWVLAVLSGGVFMAIFGFLFEKTLLFRVRDGGALPQTLLTVALSTVIADMTLAIWGGTPLALTVPRFLNMPIRLFGIIYPGFRYLLMAIAVMIALILYLLLHRTKFGIAVRASVDDRETVAALGIKNDLIYTSMFTLASLLAGISGALGGSFLSLSPGEDSTILTYSLVVIIVGGMGSLGGAIVSAILLGQILSWGMAFAPQWSMFLVFIPMAIVLAVRPQGLFGRRL